MLRHFGARTQASLRCEKMWANGLRGRGVKDFNKKTARPMSHDKTVYNANQISEFFAGHGREQVPSRDGGSYQTIPGPADALQIFAHFEARAKD